MRESVGRDRRQANPQHKKGNWGSMPVRKQGPSRSGATCSQVESCSGVVTQLKVSAQQKAPGDSVLTEYGGSREIAFLKVLARFRGSRAG